MKKNFGMMSWKNSMIKVISKLMENKLTFFFNRKKIGNLMLNMCHLGISSNKLRLFLNSLKIKHYNF